MGRIVKNLDDVFTKKLDKLMEYSANMEGGMYNSEPTHEVEADEGAAPTPPDIEESDYPRWCELGDEFVGPDRFDPSSIHDEFDRDAITSLYTDVHTAGDGVGMNVEAQVLKNEHEWLASLERDYHLRKRTRIRLTANAASRHQGLARATGPIKGGVERWLRTLLTITKKRPDPVGEPMPDAFAGTETAPPPGVDTDALA